MTIELTGYVILRGMVTVTPSEGREMIETATYFCNIEKQEDAEIVKLFGTNMTAPPISISDDHTSCTILVFNWLAID